MENFLAFINENWKILLMLILAIANLLVCIFRKKVKIVDDVREFILDNLPLLISVAERLFTDGKDKKSYVLKQIDSLLMTRYGKSAQEYDVFIRTSIEKILSTPEKKEVK